MIPTIQEILVAYKINKISLREATCVINNRIKNTNTKFDGGCLPFTANEIVTADKIDIDTDPNNKYKEL